MTRSSTNKRTRRISPFPHLEIQSKLLQWFEKHARDLPWRRTRDPYAIWVSEIMLQQTQVATVVPYYERFLKAFPTVHHLAKAPLGKVLKAWEGLGYYSRARNLHRASQIVSSHFHGRIPDNLEGLLSLPGIGRYTAGAVLSISHNKNAPALDGNVKRVLSRLFAISGKKTEDLWEISAALIPTGKASSFNQALMDLGAVVCTPKGPHCSRCPLAGHCRAKALGKPEQYPAKAPRKNIPVVEAVSMIVNKGRQVLLRHRPPKGLLGGLWEFPNWRVEEQERLKLRPKLRRHLKEEMGLNAGVIEAIGIFHHTFTHFKLTLHVYLCNILSGKNSGRWVPVRNLHLFPMSRLHRRIAQTIGEKLQKKE